MYRTDTFRIPMAGPADMTTLTALIEDGEVDPMHIVAGGADLGRARRRAAEAAGPAPRVTSNRRRGAAGREGRAKGSRRDGAGRGEAVPSEVVELGV